MALLAVEEARKRILDGVRPLPPEPIALAGALGRVLASPVIAKREQPPFAVSAMDGYAVRAEDALSVPATLKLVGMSAAGNGFKGKFKRGEAVRILTGAPVPAGATSVVIQENTNSDGKTVTILHPAVVAKNIRRKGLDVRPGDVLVEQGQKLRPRDIGLLAAGNAARVKVHRKPVICILATGDELTMPGAKARADQIYSSNSHALQAMAEALGATVINLGIVKDTLKATIAAVRKGLSADILLTTGGASVGDHDYVQAAFKACGVKIGFWKIAMRPGKPFMYGRKGRCHVMGLPGNPVSALVTARLFLKPLVERMLGLADEQELTTALLTSPMPANDDRQDYVRATLSVAADGRRHATPMAVQDSSMQRTMQQAHALIIRPPHAPAAIAGDQVPVLLIDF